MVYYPSDSVIVAYFSQPFNLSTFQPFNFNSPAASRRGRGTDRRSRKQLGRVARLRARGTHAPTKGRISNFYKSTVGAEHRAARKSDAQGTAPLHRPRTDIRPLSASSTTIQPLYNRFSTPRQLSETSTHPQPSFNRHTNHLSIAFQPPPTRSSPKPPPIRRDKAGHPHPSHTATKPNAQTLQPQLSHTARPTVPYEQF